MKELFNRRIYGLLHIRSVAAAIVPITFFLVSCGGGGGGTSGGGGGAPTYRISGAVTSETYTTSGLAGVTVVLVSGTTRTATTSANGTYTFSGLANGATFTITPGKSGYSITPSDFSSTIAASNVVTNFTATATTSYSISGTATVQGTGLANVTIALKGDIQASQLTDSGGNYSFINLANGQTYTFTPSKTKFSFSPKSQGATLSSANITMPTFTVETEIVTCGTATIDRTVSIPFGASTGLNFTPDPVTLSATPGVVKWTNNDSVLHTVTSGTGRIFDGLFDSGDLSNGQTFCVNFYLPNTYDYFCRLHTHMTAQVIAP